MAQLETELVVGRAAELLKEAIPRSGSRRSTFAAEGLLVQVYCRVLEVSRVRLGRLAARAPSAVASQIGWKSGTDVGSQ